MTDMASDQRPTGRREEAKYYDGIEAAHEIGGVERAVTALAERRGKLEDLMDRLYKKLDEVLAPQQESAAPELRAMPTSRQPSPLAEQLLNHNDALRRIEGALAELLDRIDL